ncbi:hypothetical protein D3C87_1365830 [compost metagenome]
MCMKTLQPFLPNIFQVVLHIFKFMKKFIQVLLVFTVIGKQQLYPDALALKNSKVRNNTDRNLFAVRLNRKPGIGNDTRPG